MKTTALICLFALSTFLTSAQTLIPFYTDRGYGYKDSLSDEIIVKPKYRTAKAFHQGLALVSPDNETYGYIDRTGSEIIPAKYSDAKNFSEGFAIVKLDKKWGFIDRSGKEIASFKYDYLNDFTTKGCAFAQLGNKWGVIDKYGKEILPAQFDFISFITDDLILVNIGGEKHYETGDYEGGKWGFYDYSGRQITPLKFDKARQLSRHLVAVNVGCVVNENSDGFCAGGKWGAVDKTGKLVSELQYDEIRYALVYLKGKTGCISHITGKEIFPAVYDDIRFGEGLDMFAVSLDGKWGFADSSNKVVIKPQFENARGFVKGLAAVKSGGKWGYINYEGKPIIPHVYEEIGYEDGDFRQGFALVKLKGKWGAVNSTGKSIIECKYDYLELNKTNQTFFNITLDRKQGLANKSGREIVPARYDVILLKGDYIVVNTGGSLRWDGTEITGGLTGIMDMTGKEIVPCKYEEIKPFFNGFAAVRKKDKWGFIDRSGKEITAIRYDRVSNFRNGRAEVELGPERGFVDKNGKETGIDYNTTLQITANDKKGFINLKGDTVAIPIYDYIYSDGFFSRGVINSKMTVINKMSATQRPVKYDVYGFSVLASRNIAHVEVEGKIGFVDSLGEEIIPPVYSDFKDFSAMGLIAVCTGDKYSDESKKWGLFDLKGKEVLPLSYQLIQINSGQQDKPTKTANRIVLVKMNSKYGFVDRFGKTITALKYDMAETFRGGMALVGIKAGEAYNDFKHGFINEQGKEVIPLRYDGASSFNEHGLARVSVNAGDTTRYGFIDLSGKEVIPIKYENIDHEIKCGLIRVRLNNKYGFVNLAGKEIIPLKYDDAGTFLNGFAEVVYAFGSGDRVGIIDSTGKIVVPLVYSSISRFNAKGVARAEDTLGRYAYIHISGRRLTDFYDWLEAGDDFPKGGNKPTLMVSRSRKGLIDDSGKEIIPAIYDDIQEVSLNRYRVDKNGLYGIVDLNNREVIPVKYSNPVTFPSGQRMTTANVGGRPNGFGEVTGGYWGVIDTTGKAILPFEYEAIGNLSNEAFIPAKLKGKWGYINSEGRVRIAFKYDLAGDLGETDAIANGLAEKFYALPVVIGKKFLVIDTLGNAVAVDYSKVAFSQNLCALTILSKSGAINKKGEVVLPFRYGDVLDKFSDDGTAWCGGPFGETKINTKGEYIGFQEINAIKGEKEKYGMVDKKGNILLDAKFDAMNIINKSKAIVRSNGKYGLIDKTGKEVIPLIYDEIEYSNSDTMKVQMNEKYGFVDAKGKVIVPVKYDNIEYYQGDKFMVVQLGGKYGFLTAAGREIIPPVYDEVDSFENGKVQVKLNGRVFFLNEKGKEVN